MIELKKIVLPNRDECLVPIQLNDDTIAHRYDSLLLKMKDKGFDAVVLYADLEHGSNFEYIVGFLPRFEEALLIVHEDGNAYLVLGNENLNKASKARIKATPVHMPHFSLPNQPMETWETVEEILGKTNIQEKQKIGLAGWKHFTSRIENNEEFTEIPHFIVQALKNICKNAVFKNATYLFIGENGIRTTNNANEFAHYEFGAALAGNGMLKAIEELKIGMREMDLAGCLENYGQHNNVVTIMSSGERFIKGNLYPTQNEIKQGERISISVGYKGGLQSCAGYAVENEDQLPVSERDYLEKVAKPYFLAVKTWLEKIKIGGIGAELYQEIEQVLPREKYGWSLNPGHLCADEEWLSSPVYPGSKETIKSGMLFQIDIIVSVDGYGGVNCESGVLLADEILREEIQTQYPELWRRVENRRRFLIETLGINISEEVLPTSNSTALCRPFLLKKDLALVSTT